MDNTSRLDKAILAIKNLNKKLEEFHQPIAIIGMSCKFPGSENVDQFWELLKQGKDGVREVPEERWSNEEYYSPDPAMPGKIVTKKAGLINDIDKFDSQFFNISPREAEYLDPQHRLLLEQTWLALESASISRESIKNTNTGVFIGMMTWDYFTLMSDSYDLAEVDPNMAMGIDFSTAVGRVSYFFGLHGPSMAVDTACSSSLVAIHEACKSIQHGECKLAIVGGVNAIVSPRLSVMLSKAGMLSPEGHCKTFDEKADGYARGEGCGIVILKKLSDALNDKDNILAVIKASGVNHGGASSGLTVPNGDAQETLLRQVLSDSKLNPEDIDYIECHGTGTKLGDPIEVEAIGQVYGMNRELPLKLGSVKSNIGHLESAAGVAGLIKTILSLQHEELPKNLHFNRLNSHIELNFPAQIISEPQPWKVNNRLRRAAISSFGVSGTNGHIIIEEAPALASKDTHVLLPQEKLFILSAKKKKSLEEMVQAYITYLEKTSSSLEDICYSTATGRSHFGYRIALIVKDKAGLVSQLRDKNLKITDTIANDNIISSENLHELAAAYLSGNKIDWDSYYKPYLDGLAKVDLPRYCFDKQSYWLNKKIKKTNSKLEMTVNKPKETAIKGEWVTLLSATPQNERKRILIQKIRELLAEKLKIEDPNEMNINTSFTEYGVDSITAGNLGVELGKKLNLEMIFSLFWEYNTINDLVSYIFEKLDITMQPSDSQNKTKASITSTDMTTLTQQEINKYGVLVGICDRYFAEERLAFDRIEIKEKSILGRLQVLSYFKQGEKEGVDWKWNLSLFSIRVVTMELLTCYANTLFTPDSIDGIYIKNMDVELFQAVHTKKDIPVVFNIKEFDINNEFKEVNSRMAFSFGEKGIFGELDFCIKFNNKIQKNDLKSNILLEQAKLQEVIPDWLKNIVLNMGFSYEVINVIDKRLTAIVHKKMSTENYFKYSTANNLLHLAYLVELMYLYAGWDNRKKEWKNREIFGVSCHEKNNIDYVITENDKVEIIEKSKVEAYGRILYNLEIYINDTFKMDYVATIKYFDKIDVH